MQLIKELKGHSGASVSLYDNNTVVKSGYKKARESAKILEELPFNTPKILDVTDESIVMEYINGDDIASFLEHEGNAGVDSLIKFIESYFDWCLNNSQPYNFKNELQDKVLEIGQIINISSLVAEFNSDMPRSLIHGDFTFDNIIHKDGQFYLIDANPTNLNSVYFDGAKLRQDINGFWFIRHKKNKIDYKIACLKIYDHLKSKYSFMQHDNLYTFMLCRILPYCKDDITTDFLTKELDKVWL